MLTNYIFRIPIRSKSAKEVNKAFLTGVYFSFRGSKYILSDHSSEFNSKQFTFWQKKQVLSKFIHHPTPLQEPNHRMDLLFSKSIYKKTHM